MHRGMVNQGSNAGGEQLPHHPHPFQMQLQCPMKCGLLATSSRTPLVTCTWIPPSLDQSTEWLT